MTDASGLLDVPLYQFQADLALAARKALRQHQSVLVCLPTGGGKSYITAWMIVSALRRGHRVYFCVHRKDLLTQMAGTFRKFGIPFGYIAAGRPLNAYMPVQICSIQTLYRRLDLVPSPDVLIVDEAHFSGSKVYSAIIDKYKASGAYVVGKTATPWRLDGSGLGRHFDAMVTGPTVRELMDEGYLSDYRYFAPSKPDLTGIPMRMGDLARKQTEERMDKPSITGDAVRHYQKNALGKRAVAFCCSIKHSQRVAEAFNAAGVPTTHVDGDTPQKARMDVFRDFAAGRLQVLTSVGIFSEGLDLASLINQEVTIEAAILLRPTKSLSLFLQQVGRALRKKDAPAVILDHAANYLNFGWPDDDREWSLAPRLSKAKAEVTVAIKQCPDCFAVHRPAPVCPECGYRYVAVGREINEVDGELEEIDPKVARLHARKEQGLAFGLDDLIALGRKRGYKSPERWAAHVFTARARRNGKAANG